MHTQNRRWQPMKPRLAWPYRGITLQLADGDIAEQDTEAVTTAAHWRLNGGNGTDGTIHSKGGPRILEACRRIGGCAIGDAVVTGAGDLAARYVIHAVGPTYECEGDEQLTRYLLRSAYHNTLKRAAELGVHSVAIPAISTGAFAVPATLAVPIAVAAVLDFVDTEESGRVPKKGPPAIQSLALQALQRRLAATRTRPWRRTSPAGRRCGQL